MATKRINRADAIRVAEALSYDPSCGKCCEYPDAVDHREDCAVKARDRILEAAEA